MDRAPHTMTIPESAKFVCIAIRARSVSLPDAPVVLAPGLEAHSKLPIPVESFWKEWLGVQGVKPAEESDCSLVAYSPSASPGVLDHEHEELRQRASMFFSALAIQGSLALRDGMVLVGGVQDGAVTVREAGHLPTHYRLAHVRDLRVTPAALEAAYRVSLGIQRLYAVRTPCERMKRGLHALLRSLEEPAAGDKLHQCVRAVEALLKPPIGKTTRAFVARGQTFVCASSADVLRELYEMRCQAEHINPLNIQLPDPRFPANDRLAEFRAHEAVVLASQVYCRVLGSEPLQAHFADDTQIDAFWGQNTQQRTATWGPALDLDVEAMRTFHMPR
jgi:hypothetical protein